MKVHISSQNRSLKLLLLFVFIILVTIFSFPIASNSLLSFICPDTTKLFLDNCCSERCFGRKFIAKASDVENTLTTNDLTSIMPSETEPNNTPPEANGPLIFNTTYTGEMSSSADNNDYYYFEISNSANVQLSLTNIGAGHNYSLVLRNTNLEPIGFSGNSGNADEFISIALVPDLYYIQIFNQDSTASTQPYQLHLSNSSALIKSAFLPMIGQDFLQYFVGPQEVEPNNRFSEANGPLVSNQVYNGIFSANDKNDLFYIYLPSPSSIEILLTNIGANEDYNLVLYDMDKEQIAFRGELGNSNEHITPLPVPRGKYYILVFNHSGTISTQPYQLRVAYN